MRGKLSWAAVPLAAALVFTIDVPMVFADPPAAVVEDPTSPSVAIVSPDNSECEPWDPDKSREENEVVECPWFPSIARLANGDLYLAYSWSMSHSHSGSIAAQRSTDDGATWSARQIIVSDPDPLTVDVKEPNLTVLDDGTMVMSYWDYRPSRQNRRQVYVMRSTDNGQTWSTPIRPYTSMYSANKGTVATNGEILQLADGDLLLPIYGMASYDGTLGYNAVHVLRSSDGGITWDPADERVAMWEGPIYIKDETIGYVEPALTQLSDGDILIVARTQNNGDVARIVVSEDDGDTWSTPVDEPSVRAHAPHFLTLDDGTHFLSYGDRSSAWGGGRPVVGRIYDESLGWSGTETKLIYRNPAAFGDMSYPASVQLEDGRLFTVFYDRWDGILGGTYSEPEDYLSLAPVCDPVTDLSPLPPAGGALIDLPGMAADDEITVTTDLTWTAASRPHAGPLGAVDGSHAYWNSSIIARTAPPAANYVIDLAAQYDVSAIGLTLKPGYKESAKVYLSHDGLEWGCEVAALHSEQTDAPVWLELEEAVGTRYVKVTITDSEGWAMLAEIQLVEE